jgi:CRISPR-associated protein Cas2
MRQTYLVCYDICDDKRLRKVFRIMRGYGDHLQYSIFECQFTRVDLARCQQELALVIKPDEDQVLFVDLGPSAGRGDRVISTLGLAYGRTESPCIIV